MFDEVVHYSAERKDGDLCYGVRKSSVYDKLISQFEAETLSPTTAEE